jgi:hypothetical protein
VGGETWEKKFLGFFLLVSPPPPPPKKKKKKKKLGFRRVGGRPNSQILS